MTDQNKTQHPREALIDDLEDLRELLDDQIPTLSERADAALTSSSTIDDEDQIPLITERVEEPRPEPVKPEPCPPSAFVQPEELLAPPTFSDSSELDITLDWPREPAEVASATTEPLEAAQSTKSAQSSENCIPEPAPQKSSKAETDTGSELHFTSGRNKHAKAEHSHLPETSENNTSGHLPDSPPADSGSSDKGLGKNPFLPTEKLNKLAAERATIEKLFHEQLEAQHDEVLAPHLQQLERKLKLQTPQLIQQLTDELVEEALHEFSLRLESRLQQKLKELVDEALHEQVKEQWR